MLAKGPLLLEKHIFFSTCLLPKRQAQLIKLFKTMKLLCWIYRLTFMLRNQPCRDWLFHSKFFNCSIIMNIRHSVMICAIFPLVIQQEDFMDERDFVKNQNWLLGDAYALMNWPIVPSGKSLSPKLLAALVLTRVTFPGIHFSKSLITSFLQNAFDIIIYAICPGTKSLTISRV